MHVDCEWKMSNLNKSFELIGPSLLSCAPTFDHPPFAAVLAGNLSSACWHRIAVKASCKVDSMTLAVR